jgi:hypothetical protein
MTARFRLVDAARLVACLWAAAQAQAALAGGGPENVLLVVNSSSWASQTVANHFIQLRGIPAVNVINIDWSGGFETIEGEVFRNQLLRPIFAAMERRSLMNQIDYIVYSSDFPYAIDMNADFAGRKIPEQMRPVFSLNSATYLWHLVLSKSPDRKSVV